MVERTLELNKIYCMDCLEGMKQIEDNSVDLVVTDPPYGISYKSNYGSENYKKRIQKTEWDKSFNFRKYWKQIYGKMKEISDCFVFGRWENYNIMKELEGFKQILIWDKCCGGLGDLNTFIPTYELIFYFKKGNRKPNKRTPAVIRNHSQASWKYGNSNRTYTHPTQKPKELIIKLLLISSNINDLILDPFMGSGTTAVACKQLNRNFIGFEISPEYVEIANKRLAQETLQSKEWFQ